nr:hypothetical protein CFP56_11256 [Quercus suber]
MKNSTPGSKESRMNSGVGLLTSVVTNASTNDCTTAGNDYGTFDPQHNDTSSTAVDTDEIENPHRPQGVKFVILFTCLLLGDFATGYVVSTIPPSLIILLIFLHRTPAVSRHWHLLLPMIFMLPLTLGGMA